MAKLTIGMPTYDDYDGVFFTLQALRMYHSECANDLKFLVIDNNPTSPHGVALKNYIVNWASISQNVEYVPFTEYKSTTIKNKVFEYATTPYVMCIDCHILIVPGAIKKLIEFFDAGLDKGNLLQGPLLYDDLKSISTHFDLIWNDNMWGTWSTDKRGLDENAEPFEIPAQGMGLFACRRHAWLGFNSAFRGFGGEEGYIHKKYIKMGRKTLCLPFLRWMHRFNRPSGTPYPLFLEDRFRNYLIGFSELQIDTDEVFKHFKGKLPAKRVKEIKQELGMM